MANSSGTGATPEDTEKRAVVKEHHAEILESARARFPEESFAQLLKAGATPEEAYKMLGYAPDRSLLPPDANS